MREGRTIIEKMTCKVLQNVSVQGNLSDKGCSFIRAGEGRVGVGGGGEGGWLEKRKLLKKSLIKHIPIFN